MNICHPSGRGDFRRERRQRVRHRGAAHCGGEATLVLSSKGSDHCLSFCFPAFPCGSTALTADRCNQFCGFTEGEATVLSFKGIDYCLSLCFSAFLCGSTALTGRLMQSGSARDIGVASVRVLRTEETGRRQLQGGFRGRAAGDGGGSHAPEGRGAAAR